jgi:inner membrane protein
MDNLCHTLAGFAIGEAGLKRKTALAIPTLLIGANLPDLDALAYAWGPVTALGFRRGWTHGILAMAVLPFALAGLMVAWDRAVRRRRRPDAEPARFQGLLLLAVLGIWSHPLLDLLNTYGVRLLMPFSGRWFYGDTLFIVDVWVWLALAVGVAWSRLMGRGARDVGRATWPARGALAAVLVYILLMAHSSARLRAFVTNAMTAHGPVARQVMIAPLPVTPFRRQVVVELPDAYAIGMLDMRPRLRFAGEWVQIPKHDRLPEAETAAASAEGRTYLRWARFPFFAFGEDCAPDHVCIRDARYFPQAWAEVAVPIGGTISLAPPPPSRVVP